MKTSSATALAYRKGGGSPAVIVCHPGFEEACMRIAREQSPSKNRSLAPILSIALRYGLGKCSYEEAMLEFYFGNLSLAKINAWASAQWGEEDWASVVSEQTSTIRRALLPLLSRRIEAPQIYVFLQKAEFPLKEPGAGRSVQLLAAVGMASDGMREVLEVRAVPAGQSCWEEMLCGLKRRGLHGTALFVGENDAEVCAAVRRRFPGVRYQGSLNQLESEVQARTPPQLTETVRERFVAMQKADDREQAGKLLRSLAARLKSAGAREAAARLLEDGDYQFNYRLFPKTHWSRLCDSMFLKRLLCNVRERVRILGPSLDDEALLLMLAARLRHASKIWNERRFIALGEKGETENPDTALFA